MGKNILIVVIAAVLLFGCFRVVRALFTGNVDLTTPGFNIQATRSVEPIRYWLLIGPIVVVLVIAIRAVALFGFSGRGLRP